MIGRIEALNAYYGEYDEDARLRRRHGLVEFLTTVRYVEKYLAPGMKILEIGAGTGRYSHYFARKGYTVDAVDIVEHNIEIFKNNTLPGEKVTVRRGDALDLNFLASGEYDITLLLGPMYHLYTAEDQRAAMSEAIRVTRPGGVVFAAYCNNDSTVYRFLFEKGEIDDPRYLPLIDFDTYKLSSTPEELFALWRKEDVDSLMSGFAVTRLHYVGTDMLTRYIAESVDAMDDATFEKYMNFHFCVCERPDMVGATLHMLDVFRKEG